MLTCRQITELVTDYLEGRMTFADRFRFRVHVGMCLDCHRYLRQMRATVAVLGHLPDDPLPEDVRDALMRRFRTWKRA